MKKLTIFRVSEIQKTLRDISYLENKFNVFFPRILKFFLSEHEGKMIVETYFNNNPTFKEILMVKSNKDLASIETILEGHKEEAIKGYIPFAIDSGGWDFNVSINEDTYGQVWVNKWDGGEEDTMEFVAFSFEEFINGLKSEEELEN